MSECDLTPEEALDCCFRYFNGEKVRSIHSKYDVDPRRLYEVLDGQTHPEARQEFLRQMKLSKPTLAESLKRQRRWRRGKAIDPQHPQLPF